MPHTTVVTNCRNLSIPLLFLLLAGCAADPAQKMLPAGWQQLQAGRPAEALATAQNILVEAPRSPRAAEVLYLKGRAHEAMPARTPAEQRAHLAGAHAAYAEALQHDPNPRLAGQIHAGIANAYYWQDDFNSAWRNWVKAYDLTNDPEVRSYVLYRIGLCQQRLGHFQAADETFSAVMEQYPSTDAARRSRQMVGLRGFTLQVATFASPQTAENAMNTLRREGFVPSRLPNAQGQSVVTISPFGTYQDAHAARTRLAGLFPDAVVVP